MLSSVIFRALFVLNIIGLTLYPANAVETGDQVPKFSLTSADGKEVSISDFAGKVVYLDFWASWCPPCRVSLPWMNELQNKYSSDDFVVVTINLDSDSSKAKRIIDEQRLTYPVLLDVQGKIAKLFALPAMPTSFLIGRNGKISLVHSAFRNEDKESLETSISKLIKEGTK